MEHYYAVYKKDHARFVPQNKAIKTLLTLLNEQGMKMGIITGKSRRAFDLSMESMAMPGVFSTVVTGDDVEIPKPDPTGIVSTMRKLGAVKEETIYIGDSNNDILAGKAAGIHTAGVHWLGTSQSARFDAQPDFIWTKVDDFIKLLQTPAK
ncbi:HAD-IA family hydrolase [Terrilactibacillus sp. S3-3]|nr:HAD-IA family hydrolase [Terrilactibacillus sp. S3-3]